VSSFRIVALSVLLATSASLAATKSTKKYPPPEIPKPILTAADRPKTCADQCKLMEKVMVEPCKKGAGSNKEAQQQCSKRGKDMVDACEGSCKEKGRVDKQYMLERIKPPPGYKPGQMPAKAESKKGSQGAQDEH
jgi:hypothetical protein